jgi:hypothetical protein
MVEVKHLVEKGLQQGVKTAAGAAAPSIVLTANSCQGAEAAATSSSSHNCSSSQHASSCSAVAVWCGKRFQLQLELSSSSKLAVVLLLLPSLDSVQAPTQSYSNQAGEQHLPDEQQRLMSQQLAAVQCSLCAVRFGVQEVRRKADKPRSLVAGKGRCWADFFGLGEVCSWEQVRAGLARQHLIGVGAGELHIRATVTKV